MIIQRRLVISAASDEPFVEAIGFGVASGTNKCITAPPRSLRTLLSQTLSRLPSLRNPIAYVARATMSSSGRRGCTAKTQPHNERG